MGILGGLLNPQQYQQDVSEKRDAEVYRSIMRWEAKIGGELFGPIPAGTRREFFCLDERTWVWHEEWSDNRGRHSLTTRYDVTPHGILKSQGGNEHQSLSQQETNHLLNAIELYGQRVLPSLHRWKALKPAGPDF